MSKKHVLMVILAAILGIPLLGLLNTRMTNHNQVSIAPTQKMTPPADMARQGMMGGAEPALYQADMSDEMVAEKRAAGTAGPSLPFAPTSGGEGFTPNVPRTVVKTATLSLLVNDTRQTVDKITQLVAKTNGTVTNSNVYESEYNPGIIQGTMTLRVPVDQLDSTLTQLRGLAEKVTSETVNADDRTEQKVDLDAQLKNLRATEEQLLTILRQAKNVEETLQVQREVTTVRDRIERLQAQLDNLVGDAAMATINLTIGTKESELPLVEPTHLSLWEEVRSAFRNSFNFYRNLFIAGLRILILGLPALLLAGLIWLFWRRRQR